MILPGLFASLQVVVALGFEDGHKWLSLDSVKVFMKAIEEHIK